MAYTNEMRKKSSNALSMRQFVATVRMNMRSSGHNSCKG